MRVRKNRIMRNKRWVEESTINGWERGKHRQPSGPCEEFGRGGPFQWCAPRLSCQDTRYNAHSPEGVDFTRMEDGKRFCDSFALTSRIGGWQFT